MDTITIAGMVENDFRLSIEDMLRLDQVDEAVERLRGLLGTAAGVGKILPERFLEITSADLEIGGWHRLEDRLLDHGRSNFPITAIGVTLADARQLGGPVPNGGKLRPFIKTFYFTDDAYPFSEASRHDLLDGYSREGFELQGDYRATDATLSVKGIDDLYGAIVELEARLCDTPDPAEDEIRAGSIGSCFLAALIHQALRDTIRQKGLPRSLCVFAACDGVYPFFDAPVIGSDECPVVSSAADVAGEERARDSADEVRADDDQADHEVVEDEGTENLKGEASLLSLTMRRAVKAPVMVLDTQEAEEGARCTELAAAQQMGIDEETMLRAVMDSVQYAEQVGASPEQNPFGEAGEPDPDAPGNRFEPLNATLPEDWSPDTAQPINPNLDEQIVDQAIPDAGEYLAASSNQIDEPRFSHAAPEAPAEASADDLAEASAESDLPVSATATPHSLRTRIRSSQPEPDENSEGWLRTLLERIRNFVLGR